jgi:replicative DNA helicase
MPKVVEISENIKAGKPGNILLKDSLALLEKNHKAAKGGGYAGIPTGLKDLDKALGGLQTGLHILAAQPGAGKTALALNIVRNCSRKGYPVVYASFDEVPERLLIKIISAETGLDVGKLFCGATDPQKFLDAANDYNCNKLNNIGFISAGMNLNIQDFKAQLQDQIAESDQDTGLLVIDYLQPWAASIASTQGIDYRQAIGRAAQMLRNLANDLSIPVLMISAQNRSGQDSNRMTSLRESSDLEYSADSIMLITTDEDKHLGGDRYARNLTIAKNRFGPSDKFISIILNGKTQEVIQG